MRLRKRPGAEEMLQNNPDWVVQNPEEIKGSWQSRFKKEQTLEIEIGTGKGAFIIEKAKRHPEINFVGIELQTSVLIAVLEKQFEEKLENLQLLQYDASKLQNIFENSEVDKIYLNFSDPWPKTRHEKRRLTHKSFLESYREVLSSDGHLEMKTDNRGLFEYSLVSFSENNWILNEVCLDLHEEEPEENIRTEYEEKFSKKGNKIFRGIFIPK